MSERPNRWTASRWMVLTIVLCAAALWLSWYLKDAAPFTAVATVGLGGGHLTNGLRDARHEARQPLPLYDMEDK